MEDDDPDQELQDTPAPDEDERPTALQRTLSAPWSTEKADRIKDALFLCHR
jgi:hypothetical protein